MGDLRAPHRFELAQLWYWQWHRIIALLLGDSLALSLAWKLATQLNRFYSPIPSQLVWWVWWGLPSLFWVFTALAVTIFALGGLYNLRRDWRNYLRSGKLISLTYLLALLLVYFYDPNLAPPRSLFFTAWFASVLLVIGFRLATTLLLKQIEYAGSRTPVFLIASADRLTALAQVLERQPHYRIVGAALASTANTASTLIAILKSQAQEVLAEDLPPSDLASSLYWQLRHHGITLRLVPSSLDLLYRRGVPEVFAAIPTLRAEPSLLHGLEYRLKRLIDYGGAGLGVLLLSPLFLGIAIAIKLTSPGPVFFRQERVGLQGKVFQMWKFRTMVQNAPLLQAQLEANNESKDGVLFKIKDDPRRTPLGCFLRRTSLDELPQLFNVLLGQMSLVGPRPLPLRDVERFDSWHHIRHQVMPGITGLWQISGRSKIGDFNEAARLDLYYIDNWSLNLDLEILVETVRIVLFGDGAY
uniref:Exopolysaccharide biosynthesis polyprenyl glycosylphosphotransferase n=1 Tax=Cyanothece sp. (strain PCC 7425 / ATCC 29141) TaxID=395961 RepID=B8HTR2_CYAP4